MLIALATIKLLKRLKSTVFQDWPKIRREHVAFFHPNSPSIIVLRTHGKPDNSLYNKKVELFGVQTNYNRGSIALAADSLR